MTRISRALFVLVAFTLTACGSSAPATPDSSITGDGSYTVGEDIEAGTLIYSAAGASTHAAGCQYKLDDSNGKPIGVSQTMKDMVREGHDSWFAPKNVLSRGTLKALGIGLPLFDGQTLIVQGCGTLVIQGGTQDRAIREGLEAMNAPTVSR